MMGTMFCQYETPCGWCTRLNKERTEKDGRKPKTHAKAVAIKTEEKLLNSVGENAAKFAETHDISIKEAMEQPMVKAFRHAYDAFSAGFMG